MNGNVFRFVDFGTWIVALEQNSQTYFCWIYLNTAKIKISLNHICFLSQLFHIVVSKWWKIPRQKLNYLLNSEHSTIYCQVNEIQITKFRVHWDSENEWMNSKRIEMPYTITVWMICACDWLVCNFKNSLRSRIHCWLSKYFSLALLFEEKNGTERRNVIFVNGISNVANVKWFKAIMGWHNDKTLTDQLLYMLIQFNCVLCIVLVSSHQC